MSLNGLCERLLFVEAEQTQTIVEFWGGMWETKVKSFNSLVTVL